MGGVIVIILVFGIDPLQLAGLLGQGQGPGAVNQQGGPPANADPEEDQQAKFSRVVLHDTEEVWDDLFRKMGKQYPKPTLVLFSGRVESACGTEDAAVGPFYCGGDHRVYIDLSFYEDMQRKLKAPLDADGVMQVPDADTWHRLRQRLDELGGRCADVVTPSQSVFC